MYPNPEHRKKCKIILFLCKNKKSIIKRHGSLILFNEHFIVISGENRSQSRETIIEEKRAKTSSESEKDMSHKS